MEVSQLMGAESRDPLTSPIKNLHAGVGAAADTPVINHSVRWSAARIYAPAKVGKRQAGRLKKNARSGVQ